MYYLYVEDGTNNRVFSTKEDTVGKCVDHFLAEAPLRAGERERRTGFVMTGPESTDAMACRIDLYEGR